MEECTDPRHPEHLCQLTRKGQVDFVHALTLHPTVKCDFCGAKANDPLRVCSPSPIPDISWMGDGADVKL